MITLGVDASLTATGVIKLSDSKIIQRQLIKTKPTDNPVSELERLQEIRDMIDVTDVDIAIIENVAFMARNTRSLVQLSALNYFIRERMYIDHVPFIIVPPTVLKKFATSKGNSPKELILLEVYKRYGESFTDNNLADGYVLARIGEALLDSKVKLTKPQQEVVELLKVQLCQN